jgi:hypothetical protein
MAEDPKLPPPTSPISPTAQSLSDWKNYIDISDKRPKHRPDDRKDPWHLNYQYKAYQKKKHHDDWAIRENLFRGPSKDRANLEALEDPELIPSTARNIPSHVTSEAMPLDATTREDTMREDAPLATSHDMSLSLP